MNSSRYRASRLSDSRTAFEVNLFVAPSSKLTIDEDDRSGDEKRDQESSESTNLTQQRIGLLDVPGKSITDGHQLPG